MGHSKINETLTNFRTSDNQFLIKILAPDVFDYGDSKSESWHRAKKIREVFGLQIASRTFFRLKKSCLFWPALSNNKKNYLKL